MIPLFSLGTIVSHEAIGCQAGLFQASANRGVSLQDCTGIFDPVRLGLQLAFKELSASLHCEIMAVKSGWPAQALGALRLSPAPSIAEQTSGRRSRA